MCTARQIHGLGKENTDKQMSRHLKSASIAAVGTWLVEGNPSSLGHVGLCSFGTKVTACS